jgi:hypothetical protein
VSSSELFLIKVAELGSEFKMLAWLYYVERFKDPMGIYKVVPVYFV